MFADCIFQGIFFLLLDVLSDSLLYFWNLYISTQQDRSVYQKETSDENSHQSSNK